MAILTVSEAWSADITLTRRTLLQVQSGGGVYVALEAPVSATDAAIMEDRDVMKFEAGTVLRLRARKGASAQVYMGPLL